MALIITKTDGSNIELEGGLSVTSLRERFEFSVSDNGETIVLQPRHYKDATSINQIPKPIQWQQNSNIFMKVSELDYSGAPSGLNPGQVMYWAIQKAYAAKIESWEDTYGDRIFTTEID